MKMTLDQLKVDSYATQVSENELTDVKGGSSLPCLRVAAKFMAIAAAVHDAMCSGGEHTTGPADTSYGQDGLVHGSGGTKW